jgi:DNA-binding XRE family transcriptional regulator
LTAGRGKWERSREEWEILLAPEVEAFLDELHEPGPASHQLVNQAILVLERHGRPRAAQLVDTITGSRTTAPRSPNRAAVRRLPGRAEQGGRPISGLSRWRDSGHLERAVATASGQEAFGAAVAAMLGDARGWRLAEMRRRRGLTQEQVATRMSISVARLSQIERGDVSTRDVLNRYITALTLIRLVRTCRVT